MAVNTRFNVKRLEAKLSSALALASSGKIEAEYQAALKPIAADISSKIRNSGRGASHNAEFAEQDVRIFKAASGRLNILFGWINPPDSAHERGDGGRLWYQYQDAGFNLFGNPNHPITGVGATIDRRENVLAAIEDVNYRYVKDVARILNR